MVFHGDDDTGTMSSWAIFNMIGFYPDCPGLPEYTLTTPVFNKVTIRLDPKWYKENELVIETNRTQPELYILIRYYWMARSSINIISHMMNLFTANI